MTSAPTLYDVFGAQFGMLWPNAPTDASPSIRTATSVMTDNRFISCNLSGDNVSMARSNLFASARRGRDSG